MAKRSKPLRKSGERRKGPRAKARRIRKPDTIFRTFDPDPYEPESPPEEPEAEEEEFEEEEEEEEEEPEHVPSLYEVTFKVPSGLGSGKSRLVPPWNRKEKYIQQKSVRKRKAEKAKAKEQEAESVG